jgi:hypothetical protein
MMRAHRQQQNDRNRHAQQPKQNSAAHELLLGASSRHWHKRNDRVKQWFRALACPARAACHSPYASWNADARTAGRASPINQRYISRGTAARGRDGSVQYAQPHGGLAHAC